MPISTTQTASSPSISSSLQAAATYYAVLHVGVDSLAAVAVTAAEQHSHWIAGSRWPSAVSAAEAVSPDAAVVEAVGVLTQHQVQKDARVLSSVALVLGCLVCEDLVIGRGLVL